MENPTAINPARLAKLEAKTPQVFPPLEQVTKPNLTTAEAAFYLNRAPQTLRVWSMRDGIEGLRPRRIRGLLAWSTAEVKALAGVAA
jgi:hypothetical protein